MSNRSFSADRAAFFVFEKRDDAKALRRLGTVYIVIRLLLLFIVLAIAAPYMIDAVPALFALDEKSTEFALKIQAMGNYFQAVGMLASIGFLPFFIAIYTALLRWMIFGQSSKKWFGLRFGEQELHVLVVMIAIAIITFLAILISLLPFGILVGITVALKEGGNAGLPLILSIIYGVIWLCGIIWFVVRLSPAPALTVQRGKIQVFETFAISKGHFWGLFLAYLLQFFVVLAISLAILFFALLVSLPFLGIGYAMFGVQEPDMANVRAYIALAAVPLLLLTISGLALEYLRYAMGAGVGASLVLAQAKPEDKSAPTAIPPKEPPVTEAEEAKKEPSGDGDNKGDADETEPAS